MTSGISINGRKATNSSSKVSERVQTSFRDNSGKTSKAGAQRIIGELRWNTIQSRFSQYKCFQVSTH